MSGFKLTICGLCSLIVVAIAAAVPAQDADAPAVFTVGVRVIGSRSQDVPDGRPMPMMAQQPVTGPTLPGGRLPQYQLDHRRREIADEEGRNDPRLRFLLVLPGKPLLIEAALTIDGQPFRMARENRIQKLLEDLKREPESQPEPVVAPEPKPEEVAKTEAESTADEDAAKDEKDKSVDTEPTSETAKDGDRDAAADGEKPEGEEPKDEETEPEKPPVTPPSVPAYSLPSTVLERLRRQVKATGEQVTADELRWLLSNWVDGPNLLLLKDHFQRFRANQRPVFNILDRDRDGSVSGEELAQAAASFEECDLNRNDIVDYEELERAADDPRRKIVRHSGAGRLIFLLPDEQTAVATYARLAEACAAEADVPPAVPTVPRFDADGNGQFDAAELKLLREATPDLNVSLAFDSNDQTKSQLTVDVPAAKDSRPFPQVSVTGGPGQSSVTLFVDGQLVEVSAVQQSGSDQVSLGAVNDGYPLLAAIDPNDDGRFTIRERRTLTEQLKQFDRNEDGVLSNIEAQATIRVCFGLGAVVHRELAELRRVDRGAQTPVTPGPAWFVRMDRNKDNDLSRQEFPGTDEQFTNLDTDGDLLVSADEARNAQP